MNLKADRKTILIGGILLLFIGCIVLFEIALSLKRQNNSLRSRQKEMIVLSQQYTELKNIVSSVEAKKSLTKVEGIVQAVDEIFKSIGLQQKVKSVKSAGMKEKKYSSEEEADVSVEKVTMNETLNILYRMENAPMILSIRRTSIKTSFENPSLLNITMTVGLIKPK